MGVGTSIDARPPPGSTDFGELSRTELTEVRSSPTTGEGEYFRQFLTLRRIVTNAVRGRVGVWALTLILRWNAVP